LKKLRIENRLFQLSAFSFQLSTFDFPTSALGFDPSGEKGTVAFKGLQGGGEQASGYECLRLFLVAHAAKLGLGLGPKESRIGRSKGGSKLVHE
jgi:hypothetical protein